SSRSVCWSLDGGLDATIATPSDRRQPATRSTLEDDVPLDPDHRRPLGRTGLPVTPLGFGSAPIGGLYRAVADEDAIGVVRRAWELGFRLFDTAPLYGYGASERRIGAGVAGQPRDDFVLSTKVGRLVVPTDQVPTGADVDPQILGGRVDG